LELASKRVHEAAKQINRSKSFQDGKHRLASLQISIQGGRPSSSGNISSLSSGLRMFSSSSNYIDNIYGDQLEEKYICEGEFFHQEMVEVKRKHGKGN
jgi:hypothetical protein